MKILNWAQTNIIDYRYLQLTGLGVITGISILGFTALWLMNRYLSNR